ncbi:D-glycero-beta-D-manno-heptose-7-phosphate kinase [Bradyrhizobium sp. LHD-71]|uniref:D-glycero-beta-D-manno-heptose-7-phosphate kinase n=1 Tax=Bradyrhizobium sp. LHD-71 TaxID=3072141 RepID=UPI00280D824B|nr:D-glycero-beta-D-manno-heptose-7-phosphate kinase [Bradyrhizobium sp. LHD-71]MDQ8728435.1 D-glycero-beta-D-manno-heptose-7-phosphate kinase [Bradyrhizobium sp. LHD-71]
MFSFDQVASDIARQTVLCVGDLMLDEFVYGEVSRISPEAPAPVLAVNHTDIMIGGAGNMARNIASLGAKCIFVALIGRDDAAHIIAARLAHERSIEPKLVVDPSRPTTRKMRFVSEHFSTHLLRADWEFAHAAQPDVEQELIDKALDAIPHANVVVLSDYAKGVLTPRVIREVIDAAIKAGKPVVVDPKNPDLSIYRGATIVTPNRKELAEATRRHVGSDVEVAEAGFQAIKLFQGKGLLVKRSEHGASLVRADGSAVHVPAYPGPVIDVSGPGDTAVATFAVVMATGTDWETALRYANAAASVVVGKQGTATVSLPELRARVLPHASLVIEEKIALTAETLEARVKQWRKQGMRVGFTNGCFDILHPGHIKVITDARAACDRLVVAINSDASVRRLKGAERPLQTERARAEVLAALEAVDLVVMFEEDTPLRLIEQIKPNVLVKGGDYPRDQVVGHEVMDAIGGEVLLVDFVPGFSTTSLVDRAKQGGG